MTRWNPCCCDQLVILPQDMVLVRAGWYHFMVMTKDGRINVFGDAGVRSDGNTSSGEPNYFWTNGLTTRQTVGPDGINLSGGVTSCWSLTDYSIRKLKKGEDLDPYGWLLTHNGINTNQPHPYTSGDPAGKTYFGMATLYPEACNGFPFYPCINEGVRGSNAGAGLPRNIPGQDCDQSLGACCQKDKSCELTTPNRCTGYFQGIGVPCVDSNTGQGICNIPGACCISGQNNTFAQTIKTAFECAGYTLGSTADGVTAIKTTFFGNNTNWSMGFTCSPRIEITGACCTKNRDCTITSLESCLRNNGFFQGKGTTCGSTGAICDIPGLCCVSDNEGNWEQFIATAKDCTGYTFTNVYLDPRLGITCSPEALVCGFTVSNKIFFGNGTDFTLNVNCSGNATTTNDLCPYYLIEGLIGSPGVLGGSDRLWPHGYFDFFGTGSSISRPPKTIRHEELIKVRGLSGEAGITRTVLVEKYQPMAKPLTGFHPLAIPQDLQERLASKERSVIDIECGAYHNIVRLDDNSIVCWGLNSMGQCNVPEELKPDWSRLPDVNSHLKKNLICSIHAGFSTTAVVFNDGTALCWGDPDVANAVNQWDNIRISPIKRKPAILEGKARSCNGLDSEGFPDPKKPQFPANKYNNGTFNANTDWFQLWRSGTPVYPHFDLGVETKYVKPVNNSNIEPENSIPGFWCDDCNDREEVKKDFAVGMLRSGQIVTTRKNNAPTQGKNILLSRDCNIDNEYKFVAGFVNPGDGLPNYTDTTFTIDGPNGPETLNCSDVIRSLFPGRPQCSTTLPCSAYNNIAYNIEDGEDYIKPEGIGCYTSLKEGENGVFYDPNWAKGSIYNPGQQVRPQGFTGGRYPDWNRGDLSYGWETKVSATTRIRSTTSGLAGIPPECMADPILGGRCSMNLGEVTPCNDFCPSNSSFKWKTGSSLIDYFTFGNEGVPGHFRYPIHISTTLTCIAGTNTVNWVHSARLLGKGPLIARPVSDPIQAEQSLWTDGCEKHHKRYTDCGECNYVGGNSEVPDEEIGDTRTSCIYSNSRQVDEDSSGQNNPLREEDPIGPEQYPTTWMLPSRPWGSWQFKLLTGTATPPKLDMDICSWNVLKKYGCSYITISKFGDTPVLIDPYVAGTDFIPTWFVGNCVGELVDVPVAEEKTKWDETVVRGIRRGYGYWPTSNAWQSLQGRYQLQALDCNGLPECDPTSPFYVPYSGGRCGVSPFTSAKIEEAIVNCKSSKIPCNGDTPPNLFHWCYGVKDTASERGDRVVFPPAAAAPPCRGNKGTYEFCGITGCDMGLFDECNKWCFDNPAISYATGRSFGIFLRRSPWERGLSGEFIWEKHCSKTNADYSFRSYDEQGYGRDFDGVQGTKLWLTGTLYDPCPPWPRQCSSGGDCEAAGLTGLTCGTYPVWVPVPIENQSETSKTRKRYACKGYWEQDTEQYINTKKYSQNWVFQEEECEKSFNISVFSDPDIKDRFKIGSHNLIDIFIRYIGYGQ